MSDAILPIKSLFDTDTNTGRPVAARRRVTSSERQVFLPKSCAGLIRILDRSTPAATADMLLNGFFARRGRCLV
jgi:hypothetical protein